MTKRRLVPLIAVSALLIVAAIAAWVYQANNKRKLNVLVVSACSARLDRFGVYNPASKLTPRIDEWARDAYVFTDAVAELPWQNFSQHGVNILNRQFALDNGFTAFRHKPETRMIIPPLKRGSKGDYYWGERDILNYRDGLERLKRRLSKDRDRSFYQFVHLKYMHYPYFDDVNMGESEWSRLSPRSRELMKAYTQHPEKYPDRLPVVELLLNSFDLLKKVLHVHAEVLSTAGVISDPARTAQWRKLTGFEDDVQLARELYDLKMEKFDEHAAQVLNLFDDPELQANTIVIFTGDHGEALMEHGMMGHSVNLYDEMIRYPLAVKFPKGWTSTGTRLIKDQVNHTVMVDVVKGLAEGTIDAANFEQEVHKRSLETALSRNCSGTIRSARYKGEWKFIKNLDSGKNELYNLKADPGETKNLAESEPELAWKLEEHLMNEKITPSTAFGKATSDGAMVCSSN